MCGGRALLESARALHAAGLLSRGRLARLQSGARCLRLRRSALLLRHGSAGLRWSLSVPLWLRLRRAAGLRTLSGARRTCRPSRTLLLLALLLPTLTRAGRTRLYGAALSLPLLRRLGALLAALATWRARLLLAWTVVLTGLAVRPRRLLSGRRVRPQLLLLRRLERPRNARARGRIGAAEVALLGDDLPARGLRQMHLADEAAVARDLLL